MGTPPWPRHQPAWLYLYHRVSFNHLTIPCNIKRINNFDPNKTWTNIWEYIWHIHSIALHILAKISSRGSRTSYDFSICTLEPGESGETGGQMTMAQSGHKPLALLKGPKLKGNDKWTACQRAVPVRNVDTTYQPSGWNSSHSYLWSVWLIVLLLKIPGISVPQCAR